MTVEPLWFCRPLNRTERRRVPALLPLEAEKLQWATASVARGRWFLFAARKSELAEASFCPAPWAFYLAASKAGQTLLAVDERQAYLVCPDKVHLRALTLPHAPYERISWLVGELAKQAQAAPLSPLRVLTQKAGECTALVTALQSAGIACTDANGNYADTLALGRQFATSKNALSFASRPRSKGNAPITATLATVLLIALGTGLYAHAQANRLEQQQLAQAAYLAELQTIAAEWASARTEVTQMEETVAEWRQYISGPQCDPMLLADLQARLQAVGDAWLKTAQFSGTSLRLEGCLLDRENPLAQVSPATETRVRQLFDTLAIIPHCASVSDRRLDASQPGILHFACTLELQP